MYWSGNCFPDHGDDGGNGVDSDVTIVFSFFSLCFLAIYRLTNPRRIYVIFVLRTPESKKYILTDFLPLPPFLDDAVDDDDDYYPAIKQHNNKNNNNTINRINQ